MAGATSLGVLSVHLDGVPCKVGCEFCYLGGREGTGAATVEHSRRSLATLVEMVNQLDYDELAVALSEPVEPQLPALRAVFAAAHARGKRTTITTTMQIAGTHRGTLATLARLDRINVSVDPRKGRVLPDRIAQLAQLLKQDVPGLDVVLLPTMISPEFAGWLIEGGGLAQLLALPGVDKVALSALKPPPPWCDRAFWMRTLRAIDPLLKEHLDRRLFLDCYVAARWLGLGGCPARPDLSPSGEGDGWAFRGCVYQPRAEANVIDAAALTTRLAGFTPPAVCPFPT